MSDKHERHLERQAAQGDNGAITELRRLRSRTDDGQRYENLLVTVIRLQRYVFALATSADPVAAFDKRVTEADKYSYEGGCQQDAPQPVRISAPGPRGESGPRGSPGGVVVADDCGRRLEAPTLKFSSASGMVRIVDMGGEVEVIIEPGVDTIPCAESYCRGVAMSRCGGTDWHMSGGCGHHYCGTHALHSQGANGTYVDLCQQCRQRVLDQLYPSKVEEKT